MPRPARRILLILIATVAALAPLSVAFAATLAIHPFASDDPLLGFAVADELAAVFETAYSDAVLVLGPEVSGGAIPPLVAEGGFVGLSRVVGGDVMFGPAGADLLRTGLGVDVAVTGRILVMEDDFSLELELVGEDGAVRTTLTAPHGRRDRLVAQAARVVAKALAGGGSAPVVGSVPGSLGLTGAGVRAPALEGSYASYITAVLYAAGGLVTDAATVLENVPTADLSEHALLFKQDLAAVTGAAADDSQPTDLGTARLLRRAVLRLGLPTFDDAATADAFAAVAAATDLPLANAWTAVMAVSAGDIESAHAPFAAAEAGGYAYATALAASLALATGDLDAYAAGVGRTIAGGAHGGSAALLGASVTAQMAQDTQSEKAALHELGRAAPFLAYPFERLSFIAFDEADAGVAAEALAVAVQLDPESDLYWTNLGWSYYLLGFLERSEAASLRAVELDANQFIANYNIGLVRSVTGRLDEALDAYDRALRLDPSVDDEAIKDLENARSLYPGAVAVHYSLGYLYDAEGRRADARTSLRTFVRRASAAGLYPEFVAAATQRLVVLDAPPPPLEVLGDVTAHLGVRGPAATPFHPGDTLYPAFEVSTPGDELPARLHVTLTLAVGDAGDLVVEADIDVPAGAVGYVIDTVGLELPLDLDAGTYELGVRAEGTDGEVVTAQASLDVSGAPIDLRRLLGKGIVMTGLENSLPLYSAKDLATPERLVDALVDELRASAPAAERALPTIEDGRFAGLSGGALFSGSSAEDVEDYLAYVLVSDLADYRFVFVDGYAQWAMDGAPATP